MVEYEELEAEQLVQQQEPHAWLESSNLQINMYFKPRQYKNNYMTYVFTNEWHN